MGNHAMYYTVNQKTMLLMVVRQNFSSMEASLQAALGLRMPFINPD
jgi:hypothetical protein